MDYQGYVQEVVRKTLLLMEDASACAKRYAVVKDGKIVHFKGPYGKGIRFRNCVKYFVNCKGYSEKRARAICGSIARKKEARRGF